MRRRAWAGLGVFLIFTTGVLAQQLGSPSFARVSTSQTPPPKSDEKSTSSVQVSGKVVDRDGKGVANSEVILTGPTGETRGSTDSSGAFSFKVPPGKYTITVKANGKSKSFPAEVKDDKPEPLTLLLD